MTEIPSTGIFAWLAQAEGMLSQLRSEAEDLIDQAVRESNDGRRESLLKKWALLAKGMKDVAHIAVDISENISLTAQSRLGEKPRVN